MKQSRWEEGKRRQFKPDPNSTKNEWRFRLANPSEFNEDSFLSRRSTVAGIRYVIGKKKGSDEYVVQSIRINRKKVSWTKARKWWKENEDKFHFSNDHDSITPSKEKEVRHREESGEKYYENKYKRRLVVVKKSYLEKGKYDVTISTNGGLQWTTVFDFDSKSQAMRVAIALEKEGFEIKK